jgi:hypothetical protein
MEQRRAYTMNRKMVLCGMGLFSMELTNMLRLTILILGFVPICVVLLMWSQGYVDEFYPARNQAEWIDAGMTQYTWVIRLYWILAVTTIVAGFWF